MPHLRPSSSTPKRKLLVATSAWRISSTREVTLHRTSHCERLANPITGQRPSINHPDAHERTPRAEHGHHTNVTTASEAASQEQSNCTPGRRRLGTAKDSFLSEVRSARSSQLSHEGDDSTLFPAQGRAQPASAPSQHRRASCDIVDPNAHDEEILYHPSAHTTREARPKVTLKDNNSFASMSRRAISRLERQYIQDLGYPEGDRDTMTFQDHNEDADSEREDESQSKDEFDCRKCPGHDIYEPPLLPLSEIDNNTSTGRTHSVLDRKFQFKGYPDKRPRVAGTGAHSFLPQHATSFKTPDHPLRRRESKFIPPQTRIKRHRRLDPSPHQQSIRAIPRMKTWSRVLRPRISKENLSSFKSVKRSKYPRPPHGSRVASHEAHHETQSTIILDQDLPNNTAIPHQEADSCPPWLLHNNLASPLDYNDEEAENEQDIDSFPPWLLPSLTPDEYDKATIRRCYKDTGRQEAITPNDRISSIQTMNVEITRPSRGYKPPEIPGTTAMDEVLVPCSIEHHDEAQRKVTNACTEHGGFKGDGGVHGLWSS